jgi:membrane protease YdiL (CAAX protease family)
VVAAGAVLSSIANVLEDGLKMEWAFFAFVAGLAIIELGLLALAFALVARGGQRHFALVPAGTIAGILFFVPAGGPLLLATWLLAAGLAVAPARYRAKESAA